MKLTTIALRHFRSCVNLILNTDAPRVLIAGINGVGKSSIRDAIAWALQGKCVGTDGRGLGWERLVPAGTTTLAAGLTVQGLGTIEREHRNGTRSLLIEGFTGEPTIQQQALFSKLNVAPAFLDACLDTGAFLGLQHAPAKALVLDLLQVRIPIGEEPLTLDQLDARYRIAFEERKLAKLKAKAATLPPKPTETEPMPPVAAVEAKLKEVRAELETLAKGAGANAGKRELLTKQLFAAMAFEHPLDPVDPAYIADLEERLAIMEADYEELVSADPAVLDAAVAPERLTNSIDTPEFKRAVLMDDIRKLSEHKPKQGCVLDPSVRCDTPKNTFTLRVKVLKEQLAALPTPTLVPEAPEKPSRTAPTALQTTRKALDEAKARQREFEAVEARNAAKRQEAEAIQAQLASLKDDAEVTSAIDTLKARIGKGELLLKRATEHWRAVEQYQKAAQIKTNLDADVERLEALCDLLGPNGARVAALTEAVGQFEERINAFTQAFGWIVAFQIDPWAVTVNGRNVETWSESEQFRIGIALQLAIAELSGLSFAVIDRMDMLLVKERNAVTKMLMQSPVEQIIIIAARETEQPLPSIDGVVAYRLAKSDTGRTEITERTGHGA